jgi:hypothetical protein
MAAAPMRAAADTSRILAVFTPLRRRSPGLLPATVASTAALLVFPARTFGVNFANAANFKDFRNLSLSTFAFSLYT